MAGGYDHYDDDEGEKAGRGGKWREFECPGCDAHNPYDGGFGIGDEVLCYYCGIHFKVVERDGRFKLKEV